VQFLALAKSPAGEVGSQLYVALDQKYITIETFDQLLTYIMNYSYEYFDIIFTICALYLGMLDTRIQILNFKYET
jgi:hypothetical protein